MSRISYNEVPEKAFTLLSEIEQYLSNTSLDFKTLELMRLLVSNINQCAYCVDMHYKEAVAAGETPQRLSSINTWREAPYYSEQERAVFAWAEFLTQLDRYTDVDECFAQLNVFFSKEEIVQLTLAVTMINTWNRHMVAYGFEAGHYCVE